MDNQNVIFFAVILASRAESMFSSIKGSNEICTDNVPLNGGLELSLEFLSSNKGTKLMPLIQHNEDSAELRERISSAWEQRDDRYSEERGQPGHDQKKVEMYRMGG